MARVTADQEREFEAQHIHEHRDRYLATDIVAKVRDDAGYAEKIALLERALAGITGWILDVGANTCGEAEYLTTLGYKIIANDINQVALEISAERCVRFGRPAPRYLAGDAQTLQLDDESVSFVVFNESLHHMYDPARTLAEAARVLQPGGRIFLYEPYAFNPYRRLSEIRDHFRGTLEKSFSVGQIKRLLIEAGLRVLSLERHVCTASDWKLAQLGPIHRSLRKSYVAVSRRALWLFGNLMVVAEKPGSQSRQR